MSGLGENQRLRLEKPISTRLVEHSETKVDNCTETTAQIELVGDNGVKHITDALLRSIETDVKINRVLTMRTRIFSARDDSAPAHSTVLAIFTDISNGEIEGGDRWATVESTIVSEAGIQKLPARKLKRSLANPRAELSKQEVVAEVFAMITNMKFPYSG